MTSSASLCGKTPGGAMYRTGSNPAAPAGSEMTSGQKGSSAALAKIDSSLIKIMDSETARGCLQMVYVPADDTSPYVGKLKTSADTDQTAYDKMIKDERKDFKKKTGLLARWFGKAEFAPSRTEPEKSTKTELLEKIVMMGAKIQTDIKVFADLPETLTKLRDNYTALLQKEAGVIWQIEGYTAEYESAQALAGALGMLSNYGRLSNAEKEKVKAAITESGQGVNIDFEDAETRQMLIGMLPETEKKMMKIEIDFPFAKETLLSTRRRIVDIEKYDAGEVQENFVPAMRALHKLKLRYEEAKTAVDTMSPATDLAGIISGCNELVDETDHALEKARIEADVDREVRQAIAKDEGEKPADMLSEMYSLLGKAEAVPSPAKEEVIIDAEFTEVGKKEA